MSDTKAKKITRGTLKAIGYISMFSLFIVCPIYLAITNYDARIGFAIALGIAAIAAGIITLYAWAWSK